MLRFGVMHVLGLVLVLLASTSAAACSSSKPVTPTPTVVPVVFSTTEVRVGGRALHLDVASDAVEAERGLGYRDSLAADDGMIFDLHNTLVPQFWMKGMRFALDFVWIDERQRVVSVTTNVPAQPGVDDAALTRYSPPTAVRYVIEVNAGAAERLGLTPDAQLQFGALPPTPE